MDSDRPDAPDQRGRARRVLSTLSNASWSAIVATLAGGALLVRAVRSDRRRNAFLQGLLGAALLALGLRQRLSRDGGADAGQRAPEPATSAEPAAPGDPGVGTAPAGGPVERGQPGEPTAADVETDEEIAGSDSATAAEPSEATGPRPEQAEPTQTEDTEPEASPAGDSSHVPGDATGGRVAEESTAGGDSTSDEGSASVDESHSADESGTEADDDSS